MKVTRRKFILGTGAVISGSLVIGVVTDPGPGPVPGTRPGTFQPNAYLQITAKNEIIFQMSRAEMGQGVHHGMTTIIAEELNVQPASIKVELAGVHPEFALMLGQVTGGSTSTAQSWDPLREAGAAARAILVQVAANFWGIETNRIEAVDAVITNKETGEKLKYGDLITEANALKETSITFRLKDPSEYRFVGKPSKRNDSFIKSTGKAQFGIDVNLPNLKTAVVVRARQFGAILESWNSEQVREQPGVIHAFEIESGVAIIADGYWQARQAAHSVQAVWQDGTIANLDYENILESFKTSLSSGDIHNIESEGDLTAVLADNDRVLQAEYDTPLLAHSTMEPQNATALFDGEKLEIWAPTQGVDLTQQVAAYYSGLQPENIKVNGTLMGGGFGRRAYMDFAGEAASIAVQMPNVPIKLVWSREDDMQHDFYRPAAYHELKGALDENGKILGWEHTVVSNSIMKGMAPDLASVMLPSFVPLSVARSIGKTMANFIESRDPTMTEGAIPPYKTPNLQINSIINQQTQLIPVGFWRSVGSSHTAFASEIFTDEMAHAASIDPVEFRRQHLENGSRYRNVLDLAAEKADWGNTRKGIYQGFAMHFSFESHVANVVEVSLTDTGYRIERVVSAVDCGLVINPDIVIAQVQSSIIYGLTAATKNAITIKNGGVEQNNFHDSPVIRMNEIPKMEVYIVQSDHAPTGIGEPGLPPVAPALANALFAATGQRLRKMPLRLA